MSTVNGSDRTEHALLLRRHHVVQSDVASRLSLHGRRRDNGEIVQSRRSWAGRWHERAAPHSGDAVLGDGRTTGCSPSVDVSVVDEFTV